MSNYLNSFNFDDSTYKFWQNFFSKENSKEDKISARIDFETYIPFIQRIREFAKKHEDSFLSSLSQNSFKYKFFKKFISEYKSSRLDTFDGLDSIEKFSHNFHCYIIIFNSKYFLKFRLKHFQNLYDIFSTIKGMGKSIFYQTAENIKQKLKNNSEQLANIAASMITEDIKKLENCLNFEIKDDSEMLDFFIKSFEENFGELNSVNINKIHTSLSFIKKFKDVETYISLAKKKDDSVIKNNYEFYADNNSKIRFRTLQDLDPRYFSIGAETACCQRIGGVGEAAAIDSFINSLAGVIILEIQVNGVWNLVSQSYFHYVPQINTIIMDNIEAGTWNDSKLIEKTNMSFDTVYAILGKKMVEAGFDAVLCGKEYTLCLHFDRFKSGGFNTDFIINEDKDSPGYNDKDNDKIRHFEFEKIYTDFDRENFTILSCPNFEVKDVELLKLSFKSSLMTKLAIYMAMNKKDVPVAINKLSKALMKSGFQKECVDLFFVINN